jgi:hypothetical protein
MNNPMTKWMRTGGNPMDWKHLFKHSQYTTVMIPPAVASRIQQVEAPAVPLAEPAVPAPAEPAQAAQAVLGYSG